MSSKTVRDLVERARALAAEHNAHWFEDDSMAAINVSVWTPAGRRWISSGGHSLVAYDHHDASADAWQDLIGRMGQGTEICDADACDTCDEEWAEQRGDLPACTCDFCRAKAARK